MKFQNYTFQGLVELLVKEKLLSKEESLKYKEEALKANQDLLLYLIDQQLISAEQTAFCFSNHFGLPFLDLDSISENPMAVNLVGIKLIQRHHILPFTAQKKQLQIAIDNPFRTEALKEIQFHTGLDVLPSIVESDKLHQRIQQLITDQENQNLIHFFTSEINSNNTNGSFDEEDEGSVVQFVNHILSDAIKKKASDIHFEPFESHYRIRYRQDGILNQITTVPLQVSTRIAARIKVLSNLDITEKRLPQDGGFKMTISKNCAIDCRVSSCPMVYGEKIVVRLLNLEAAPVHIDALGFNENQKHDFIKTIHRPHGLVLVTGPTGSGKTLTLYSALHHLNTSEKNISTVEDPVEVKIPGINQVNINSKVGLTFATALRSFLRQDPDILMIGEIRDTETAEIAIKAAQTGHLVLSTLHTNSAAETVTRLLHMGISSLHITTAISLIIAQRLVRTLCEHCKTIDDDITSLRLYLSDEEKFPLFKAKGCSLCTNGYRGRTAIFELLPMTRHVAHLIMSNNEDEETLKTICKEKTMSLYQSGIAKVKQGITTFDEVNRVIVH